MRVKSAPETWVYGEKRRKKEETIDRGKKRGH